MKKLLKRGLVMTALILFCLFVQAQTYVSFNVGYAGKMGASNLNHQFDFWNFSVTEQTMTEEQIHLSFGRGINAGATFGHMFSDHLGAELGVSYLQGFKYEAEDIYYGGDETVTYTFNSRMARFMPSVVIEACGDKAITPYARLGVIIGVGSVTYEMEECCADFESQDMYMKMKLNGGVSFGMQGGMGARYKLSDRMAAFAEVNVISMSYAPEKGEITEYTIGGEDVLSDLTISEKEMDFVNEYTISFDSPPNSSEPTKELKQKMPFGSVGLNLGLRINLTDK